MRNAPEVLIVLGAFWLSAQLVVPFGWLFGKLNEGIIYGDSVAAAIGMGIMTSMGRAIAASIGALLAVAFVQGPKPQRWVLLFALLWVLFPQVRHHWRAPLTIFDRIWYVSDLLWPALACTIATLIAVHFWNKRIMLAPQTPPTNPTNTI